MTDPITTATTFLWYDDQAEPAAEFYAATIDGCRVDEIRRTAGAGSPALTVAFSIGDQHFVAMNGGPHYALSPAVSIQLGCPDQATVDRYWDALLADGGEPSQCGWLVDRFGLSWQVTPDRLLELVMDPDPARAERAFQAMLTMQKIDIAAIEAAADAG